MENNCMAENRELRDKIMNDKLKYISNEDKQGNPFFCYNWLVETFGHYLFHTYQSKFNSKFLRR